MFSIYGQLVGHYPIADWLRVACGYIKCCAEETRWTDLIGDSAQAMLVDLLQQVKNEDPVKGVWACKNQNFKGQIWCDASGISVGCALEINDQKIVEDTAWLRKKDDTAHINVAELDIIVCRVNLAIKWSMKELSIVTDSATVCGWLKALFTNSHRIQTHGITEMIVR